MEILRVKNEQDSLRIRSNNVIPPFSDEVLTIVRAVNQLNSVLPMVSYGVNRVEGQDLWNVAATA